MKKAYLHVHIVTVDDQDHVWPDGGILYEGGTITAVGESASVERLARERGARSWTAVESTSSRDWSIPIRTCTRS